MNAEFSVICEKESKLWLEFLIHVGNFGNQLSRVKYELFGAGFKNSKLLHIFTGDGTLSESVDNRVDFKRFDKDFLSYTRFGDLSVWPFSFSMHPDSVVE